MSESGQDKPKSQYFYGPASFGGNNNGTINNVLLDSTTKATLAKLSKDAPALAGILTKALRDGVISPDVVSALQSAVQNINHDVADRLWYAAQHITPDVADLLYSAGGKINEKTANRFVQVNDQLNQTARDLECILSSFNQAAAQLNSHQQDRISHPVLQPVNTSTANSGPTGGVDVLHSSQSTGKWRFALMSICCSSGVGLLSAVILMKHHLGGYATLAGVIALLSAALLRYGKVRR
jgi:ankyrin repeat protein